MNSNLKFEEIVKPWGDYKRFTLNKPSTVKLLTVLPFQQLSLQTHDKREEFWRLLPGGEGIVTLGDNEYDAKPGDEFYIPYQTKHRLKAKDQTVYILEISFGDFDEDDIKRLTDDYGRE